jgi:hypothetical protein
MLNHYNDTMCHNNFANSDFTQDDYLARSNELARGPITENGVAPNVSCELETPYTSDHGYSTDKFCPFPLPVAENVLFSGSSDPESNLRSPISVWNYLDDQKDSFFNPGSREVCTYICTESGDGSCTLDENTYKEYCNGVDMYGDSSITPEENCINSEIDGKQCNYFKNIPLQQTLQNQERYYIVNQEYGGNLFS